MILSKPGETHDYVPPGQDDKPEAERVSYHLRTPSVYDGPRLRRAVAAAGARAVSAIALLEEARRGIEAMLSGEEDRGQRSKCCALIDERIEELRVEPGALFAASKPELLELLELVRRGWERFAQLAADDAFYWDSWGIEAARLFVAGWRNRPGCEFARTGGQLSDRAIATIPRDHQFGIGIAAALLMAPTEAEKKTSGSPSPGSSTPKPSTAPRTRRPSARSKTIISTSNGSDGRSSESIPATSSAPRTPRS